MKNFIKIIKKILKIHSPSHFEYHEKDTKCDLCEFKSKCEPYLFDCTMLCDTRKHVTNSIGHICPKNIRYAPCDISCNGEPCTSCDVYRKLKEKEND